MKENSPKDKGQNSDLQEEPRKSATDEGSTPPDNTTKAPNGEKDDISFPIVGMGASAGGKVEKANSTNGEQR